MNTKDGGPAFPIADEWFDHPTYGRIQRAAVGEQSHPGMSLRDYFAAHALASTTGFRDAHKRARRCYRMADAMLAAREVTP